MCHLIEKVEMLELFSGELCSLDRAIRLENCSLFNLEEEIMYIRNLEVPKFC